MRINQTLLLITIILICSCSEPKQNLSCDNIEELQKLASENNSEAQAKLVICYQKAADQGDAFALYNLGVMYNQGEGVSKDLSKAVEFYQKAADQGHAMAQTNLGFMYGTGTVVDKDLLKAVELYRKAADQGDAMGQTNLGFMYSTGAGVDKDSLKAVELYRKAADQGFARAQTYLGIKYATGDGVDKDLLKAIELYRKAADQGFAPAQANLGFIYYYGKGVDKDLLKAVEFFQKAADQGDADAQNILGALYYEGTGVDKDLLKAKELFQKAADQGHELAKKNLQDKSLQVAIPFGLKIGVITLDQVKEKYKVTKKGNNKWTDKPMYQIDPISQIDFEGIQELTLIFDDKDVLHALIAKFGKERFYSLLRGLEEKYNSSYMEIPSVGNKEARFTTVNGIIILEAMHLESHTFLLFGTKEFVYLKENKMQTEKLLKKQKEQSML